MLQDRVTKEGQGTGSYDSNSRQVKTRLNSGGVDTIDAPSNSKNQHGEFTMMNPMTFIDESNLYRCPYYDIKLCGSQVRVHKSTEGYT